MKHRSLYAARLVVARLLSTPDCAVSALHPNAGTGMAYSVHIPVLECTYLARSNKELRQIIAGFNRAGDAAIDGLKNIMAAMA